MSVKELDEDLDRVRDRTIGELMDYLIKKSSDAKGAELLKVTRTFAEIGLAIYDFADYLRNRE